MAVRAAIRDPLYVPLVLSFETRDTRYVEVRQVGWSAVPWALAEFGAVIR